MTSYQRQWDDGLKIRELTEEENDALIRPNHASIFNTAQPRIFAHSFYSEEEKNKLKDLFRLQAGYRLTLGAFFNGEFAGWHFGHQATEDTYFMRNSAVLPDFRRKRIYERILQATLEKVTAAGFQKITSDHHPSNTAVLIAKLKVGFWISGVHVDDRFGTLVDLVWYPHQVRRDAFEYRVGHAFPSSSVQKLLER
jgi:ribosomal protein S18 acetylase RimI-like enzyme